MMFTKSLQSRFSKAAPRGFEGEDLKKASEVFYNLEVYDDDEKTLNELINSIKVEKIKKQIITEKDPQVLNELLREQARLTAR